MLDSFVIDKNDFYQFCEKTTKVKNAKFNKLAFVMVLSLVGHVLLMVFLLFISSKQVSRQLPRQAQKHVNRPYKPIQSYLYKKPKKIVPQKKQEVTAAATFIPEQASLPDLSTKTVSPTIKPASNKQASIQPRAKTAPQKDNPVNSPVTKASTAHQPSSPKNTEKPKISAYKQLGSLRNAINEKIISDDLSRLQTVQSPSIFNQKPALVPHANQPLSTEQTRLKNTNKLSNDIAITKLDDGWCMIEREQFLGSPIEGSRSVFACGESKFDKNFREHMQRVREKIMPVKNNTDKK